MTLDFESKQTPAMKNMPEVNTTLQTIIVFIFTARRHTSAVCGRRVFVCLSQVGVLLKRLNAGSRKQRHTIAQGL